MELNDAFDGAIAAALRSKLGEKNITRITVSERTGIPLTTLERYFKGTRAIPASKFVVVADAIGVEPGKLIQAAKDILEGTEEQHRIEISGNNHSE